MSTKKPNTKRLTERCLNPLAGARVDREAGVIRGVVLCGFESANGRTYPPAVFKRDLAKYEGKPVNIDHSSNPSVSRQVGWVENVRLGADGRPRGDLHLKLTHVDAPQILETAERRPQLFGMSHVADCRTRADKGRDVIESIEAVRSIDIVSDPATNPGGLFEGRTVALTVKQLCESLVKHPKTSFKQLVALKKLGEMDGMDAAPTMLDAPPADDATEPDAAVMAAFKSAISAVVDQAMSGDLDAKEALKKIKGLLSSHAGLNADGTPDTDSNPATGGGSDGDDTTPESKQARRTDPWVVLAEARAECGPGYMPGPAELEALACLPSPEARKAFLAERRAAGAPAEKPKSGGRYVPLSESKAAPPPTDLKTFLSSVMD